MKLTKKEIMEYLEEGLQGALDYNHLKKLTYDNKKKLSNQALLNYDHRMSELHAYGYVK